MPGRNYSVLSITELVGDTLDAGRQVVLTGPWLPFQLASWPGKQRVTTTWYNGNPDEATQQVMGPVELPSEWEGEWRRTMTDRRPAAFFDENGGQTQIVHPHVMADLVEDMFRTGARLRVTWTTSLAQDTDGTGGGEIHKVREGRCTQWEFPYERLEDVHWKLTFEWLGRGRRQQKVAGTPQKTTTSATNDFRRAYNQFLATKDKFRTAVGGVDGSATTLSIGQLEKIADYPLQVLDSVDRTSLQILDQLDQAAQLAQTVALTPVALAQKVLAICQNALAVLNQERDRLNRIPVETSSLNQRAADVARSAAYLGQTHENLQDMIAAIQAAGIQAQQQLDARNRQDSLGKVTASLGSQTGAGQVERIYQSRSGDTPASISRSFYGNPDFGPSIMYANRLPWYQTTIDPGSILIIPANPQKLP